MKLSTPHVRSGRTPLRVVVAIFAAIGVEVLIVTGWVVPGASTMAFVLAAALASATYVVVFRAVPRVVVTLALAVLVLVPVYWAPPITGLVPFTPSVVVVLPLLFALSLTRPAPKVGVIDVLVSVGLAWSALAMLVNYSVVPKALVTLLVFSAAPYLLGRYLATDASLLSMTSIVMRVLGVVVAVLALVERATGVNVFLTLVTPQYSADVWARLYFRGGELRSAVSLAQPLVLGVFLLMCFALTVFHSKRRRRYLAVVVIFGGIWATGSRLALVIALVVMTINFVHERRSRLAFLLPLGTLLLASLVATGVLAGFIAGDGNELAADSASYRLNLAAALLNSDVGALGVRHPDTIDFGDYVGGYNGSVDNEYLLRLIQFGWFGVAIFALAGIAVLIKSTTTKSLNALGWGVAALSSFFSYFFVASLVQQASFFWITLGICSVILQKGKVAHPRLRLPGVARSEILEKNERLGSPLPGIETTRPMW